jgi:hypothetical protein
VDHGSPGDAKHRPETRGVAALLTMRVLNRPHPEEAQSAVSKDEATELENALAPSFTRSLK